LDELFEAVFDVVQLRLLAGMTELFNARRALVIERRIESTVARTSVIGTASTSRSSGEAAISSGTYALRRRDGARILLLDLRSPNAFGWFLGRGRR
jgi:hypothetical protein